MRSRWASLLHKFPFGTNYSVYQDMLFWENCGKRKFIVFKTLIGRPWKEVMSWLKRNGIRMNEGAQLR